MGFSEQQTDLPARVNFGLSRIFPRQNVVIQCLVVSLHIQPNRRQSVARIQSLTLDNNAFNTHNI